MKKAKKKYFFGFLYFQVFFRMFQEKKKIIRKPVLVINVTIEKNPF